MSMCRCGCGSPFTTKETSHSGVVRSASASPLIIIVRFGSAPSAYAAETAATETIIQIPVIVQR